MFNDREQDILHLASKFLEEMQELKTTPDEVAIDSTFLLRFDPICVQQICGIRQTAHALFGRVDDAPFTQDDGWRLYFHLERHWEVRITNELSQAQQRDAQLLSTVNRHPTAQRLFASSAADVVQ